MPHTIHLVVELYSIWSRGLMLVDWFSGLQAFYPCLGEISGGPAPSRKLMGRREAKARWWPAWSYFLLVRPPLAVCLFSVPFSFHNLVTPSGLLGPGSGKNAPASLNSCGSITPTYTLVKKKNTNTSFVNMPSLNYSHRSVPSLWDPKPELFLWLLDLCLLSVLTFLLL